MLNKENIIKMVKDMNILSNEYWICAGAGLVIHGVKEGTNDIDLGCTTNLVEHFLEKGCQCRISENGLRIIDINGSVEILENWFVDEIQIIDGLPVASLESIKKQKEKLGRDKDFKDIKLIDEYIQIKNSTKR